MTDSVKGHKTHPVIPLCGLRAGPEINGVFRDTQFHNLITSKMKGKGEGVGLRHHLIKCFIY